MEQISTTDPLHLKQQMLSLNELQKLDIQMDAIVKKQKNLPQHIQVIQADLKKQLTALDGIDKVLATQQATFSQLHNAIALNTERQQRAQEKLSAVTNAQQYQAAQKELDQLKKLAISLQEQLKQATQAQATLENQRSVLQKEHDELEVRLAQETSQLKGENAEFQTQVDQLQKQRNSIQNSIEPKILVQYQRVRLFKSGIGVATIISGQCKACHMMVPAQMFNEILKIKELHNCPHCRRLLLVFDEGET